MLERRPFALLALLLAIACSRQEGPAPVAWDRTRCAQCGMLVSDPAFAAQRHSDDGEVFHYDDPGCLLLALDPLTREGEAAGEVLYFHHHAEDRWLRGEETVFIDSAPSPMAYDLGALSESEVPQGLSIPQARARVLALDRARGEP